MESERLSSLGINENGIVYRLDDGSVTIVKPGRNGTVGTEREIGRAMADKYNLASGDVVAGEIEAIPILEPRQAIFYAYHDPSIALQQEDIDYYRYHPLLLNAAFIGDLSVEDQRILGFGDRRNYQTAFVRAARPTALHRLITAANGGQVRMQHLHERISARLQRYLRLPGRS